MFLSARKGFRIIGMLLFNGTVRAILLRSISKDQSGLMKKRDCANCIAEAQD